MKTSKDLYDRASASGKVKERSSFLKLAPKNEQGVSIPNGPHYLTLVRDRVFTDQMGEQKLEVTVLEDGHELLWTIPLKDKEGNLHYLVQTLKEYNEGEQIVAEMKKNGAKSYVQVSKIVARGGVPTVQMEEEDEFPPLGGELDPTEIPF